MKKKPKTPSRYQRNALAPGLIAAAALFVAPALLDSDWFTVVRFIVAILALIVASFAYQERQLWWMPAFGVIAIVWNPVIPIPAEGPVWVAAQPVAAVVFLVAGAIIKRERA
ncbi:DUF6804 family protein [Microbacterium sp.]|uniref:DUF6804 family protein n=1 Tax=Microbacterium sp. TaxID=51671 RepID=UPI0025DA4D45|nr:DUF6804 family protein [Microbacterium sp.]MBT9605031.1 hypothetical protein [Microbacterium sp.]